MLSEFIKEYMKVKKYSLKEIATRCNINYGSFSSILNNKKNPSYTFLKNFSAISGFSIDMLIKLSNKIAVLDFSDFKKKKYIKSLIDKKYINENASDEEISKFLQIINFDRASEVIGKYKHQFRGKSKAEEIDVISEIACFNKRINKFKIDLEFDLEKFKEKLDLIKKMINSNGKIEEVIKILKSVGIYVINSDVDIHSSIRGIKIETQNACFIYMTNNGHNKYYASYLMTLIHELFHIIKNKKSKVFKEDSEIDKAVLKWLLGNDVDSIMDAISLEMIDSYADALNINRNILQNYVAIKKNKSNMIKRKKNGINI